MRLILCSVVAVLMASSVSLAADKKPEASCQDNLRMANDLAHEYYDKRDVAEREKVMYKSAFETEQRTRKALESQIAELKKQLEPQKKADEKKTE